MRKRVFPFLFAALLLTCAVTAQTEVKPFIAAALAEHETHEAYLYGFEGELPLFAPADPLTRAQAEQLLAALLREAASRGGVPLPRQEGAPPEAAGDASPDERITRAEFARALTALFPLRGDAAPFADVPDGHPDAASIRSLRAYGWVQGDDENRFRPDDPITRIEAVVILNRALGRIPDQAYIDQARPAYFRDVTPQNWYYYEVMEAVVPHACERTGSTEHWTGHTPSADPPEEGFHLIDGRLYYFDSARQDILRNTAHGVLTFSASGQCTAGSARLDAMLQKFVAAHEGAHPSLAGTLEYLDAEIAKASEWNLILVNGENPLPEGFTVPALTAVEGGYQIDSRVAPALESLLDGARAAGFQPMICSAYRSWDKQTYLHQRRINRFLQSGYSREKAVAAAAFWVAKPGTSEHQAGLAVDIVDAGYQALNKSQEKRPVQQWLMAHCAEYGFILRYPTDKSSLTGVGYEPWHYRYVGVEAAREIMSAGICLEEYLGLA